MSGSIIIHDPAQQQWFAIPAENRVGRQIEPSQTETVMYGPKDSFTEQLDVNLSLLRRRLPLTNLKAERLTVGSLSKTSVVIVYIAGLTNPELIEEARKIAETDFDMIFDSAQLTELIEDHHHSIFPQFQQTERPDISAYNLSIGKIAILVDQTPFVLHAPITFFTFSLRRRLYDALAGCQLFRMLRYASFSVYFVNTFVCRLVDSSLSYVSAPDSLRADRIKEQSAVQPVLGSGPYAARHRNYQGSQRADADKIKFNIGCHLGDCHWGSSGAGRLCQQSADRFGRHLNGRVIFGAQLHRR